MSALKEAQAEDPDENLIGDVVDTLARSAAITTFVLGLTALLATLSSLVFLCPGIVVYTLSLSLTLTAISNTFITATLFSSVIAVIMSAIQLISATLEIDYDLSKLSEQESKDRENEANDNFMLTSIGFNLSFIANLLNGFVEKKQEISNKIEKQMNTICLKSSKNTIKLVHIWIKTMIVLK